MRINFDIKEGCAYKPSHNAHERSLHAIQPYKRKSDWEITLGSLSVYYVKEQSLRMEPFNWGDRWIQLSLFCPAKGKQLSCCTANSEGTCYAEREAVTSNPGRTTN